MRADLHIHSVYSDGRHTPKELAEIAKKNGVDFLAVTDHDNMEGADEKRREIEGAGLLFTHGIEISAYTQHKVHVTGYACDPHSKAYQKFLSDRKKGGLERAEDILEKCRKIGIALTLEDIYRHRPMEDSPIHTMHIARAMHEKGVGEDEFAVYRDYLAKGKPCHSGLGRPTPYEAIDYIHSFGGIACLAHPGRIHMSDEEKRRLIVSLKEYGLDGIECVYSTHTPKETMEFLGIAKELSLFVTGGSDTHIEGLRRNIGLPNFTPSEALLERIRPTGGK